MNSGTSAGSNWLPEHADELHHGVPMTAGRLVRPAAHDDVVGVSKGHDAGTQRDLLALQAVGIARAVPALVVVADDGRDLAGAVERAADAGADLGVAPQLPPLATVERLDLVQQRPGDGDLADVVQQRAVRDALELVVAQPDIRREARGR